jgi:hypothetical protein
MAFGPIDLRLIKFPENRFSGEIARVLNEFIEAGTIRLYDFVFVRKDEDGGLTVLEIDDLDAAAAVFDPVVADISELLTEDARRLASTLENHSSAGLLLSENTWAPRFVDAVAKAGGEALPARCHRRGGSSRGATIGIELGQAQPFAIGDRRLP